MGLRTKMMLEAIEKNEFTIACVACKKNMWLVKLLGTYGSKIKSEQTPFPGCPPYKEYWAKDQKTALRTDCPFCGEPYMKAVKAQGHVFAKPYIVEFDSFY